MKLIRRAGAPVLLLWSAMFVAACGADPEVAGDECDPDDSPACPAGMICAAGPEGDAICLLQAGQACDQAAANAYCYEGVCVADENGAGRCGISEGGACDPQNNLCAGDQECAEMQGGGHACYPPVFLRGMVFDAESQGAIEGANVVGLDDQSTPVSDVEVTDAAGNYSLAVPVQRNADGSPIDTIFTLRASAQDYQTFPSGIRAALPINTGGVAAEADGWVIQTPLTDIALIMLTADQQGLASISGTVDTSEDSGGVLVVAEAGGPGYSAVSGRDGDYTIFNVPDGAYTVMGYAAGLQLQPATADVAGANLTGVDLLASGEALGSISGSINIVNAPGDSVSSVVLVVDSTFNDTFVRGEVPPGLRAPLSGPPSISGAFTIENVPQGTYKVLAAFENDLLVRDPDPSIAGTQIVTQTMAAPGSAIDLSDSFKVTEALEVISPGKDGPEAVSGTPTFQWVDDSSESYYSIVVYNAYGELVWEDGMVPNVSGGNVSVSYGGPALEQGMYYQWRATSWKQSGNQPAGPISNTEDLRGVFYVE